MTESRMSQMHQSKDFDLPELIGRIISNHYASSTDFSEEVTLQGSGLSNAKIGQIIGIFMVGTIGLGLGLDKSQWISTFGLEKKTYSIVEEEVEKFTENENFIEVLTSLYFSLLESQESLGPEVEKAISKNMGGLYLTD